MYQISIKDGSSSVRITISFREDMYFILFLILISNPYGLQATPFLYPTIYLSDTEIPLSEKKFASQNLFQNEEGD